MSANDPKRTSMCVTRSGTFVVSGWHRWLVRRPAWFIDG